MANPNALNQNSESSENKWDSVAAMADEKDWATKAVEREHAELESSRQDQLNRLNDLREQAKNAATSVTYYDGGNLDAKTMGGSKFDDIKESKAVSDSLWEDHARRELLSTAEGRAAAAEKMRKDSEDYNKYYTLGVQMLGIAELQDYDRRIAEATDDEARKHLEDAKREYIEERIIPAGKIAEVNRNNPAENSANQSTNTPPEQPTQPELTPEEKAARRKEWNKERISKFVEQFDRDSLIQATGPERAKIQMLLDGIERYESSPDKPSRADKKKYEERIKELTRYGYDANRGQDSSVYKELTQVIKFNNYQQAAEIGKHRAADWKSLDIALRSDDARKVKKALKKAGYKKLPESWNDDNFTTYEIQQMSQIAQDLETE